MTDVIVIDPGHGGSSPAGNAQTCVSSPNNAVGPQGTLEKTLTLDISLRLRDVLRDRGREVVLTRATDVNLSLKARADKARTIAAPVFVSVHFNGSTEHTAQGTETFVHNDHRSISANLCRAVQARLVAATGRKDRNEGHPGRVKTAGLCVLRKGFHASTTACCLVEISFLDRADEEQRLRDTTYRNAIAAALADGIETYLAGVSGVAPDRAPGAEPEPEAPETAVDEAERVEDGVDLAARRAGTSVQELMRPLSDAMPLRSPRPHSERRTGLDPIGFIQEQPLLSVIFAFLAGVWMGRTLSQAPVQKRRRDEDAEEICDTVAGSAIDDEAMGPSLSPGVPDLSIVGSIVTNPAMNPIFGQNPDMRRASRFVKQGTLERHRAALPMLQRGADFFHGRVMVNDSIAKAGTSRESETTGSRHFYGDAFDLSTRGMDNRLQMRLALSMMKAGFKGFGFGANILHVDRGAQRAWNYGNATYAGVRVAELDVAFTSGRVPQRFFGIAGITGMDDL